MSAATNLATRLYDLADVVSAANVVPLNCELRGIVNNAVKAHGIKAVLTELVAHCRREEAACLKERLGGDGWLELSECLDAVVSDTNFDTLDGEPIKDAPLCRGCRAGSEVCTC